MTAEPRSLCECRRCRDLDARLSAAHEQIGSMRAALFAAKYVLDETVHPRTVAMIEIALHYEDLPAAASPFSPVSSPGMTDLMVTPEALDEFLSENPPEANVADGGTQPPPGRWEKLPCGCYAEFNAGHWWIAASAFTCDHRQGDNVHGAPPEWSTDRG